MKKGKLLALVLIAAIVVIGGSVAYLNFHQPTVETTTPVVETKPNDTKTEEQTNIGENVNKPTSNEVTIDKIKDEVQQQLAELPLDENIPANTSGILTSVAKFDGRVKYKLVSINGKTCTMRLYNTTDSVATIDKIYNEGGVLQTAISGNITLNPKEDKIVDIVFLNELEGITTLVLNDTIRFYIYPKVNSVEIADTAPLKKDGTERFSAGYNYGTQLKNEIIGNGILKGRVVSVDIVKKIDGTLETKLPLGTNNSYLAKVILNIANTTDSDIVLDNSNVKVTMHSNYLRKTVKNIPYSETAHLRINLINIKANTIQNIELPAFMSQGTLSSIYISVGDDSNSDFGKGIIFGPLENMEQ